MADPPLLALGLRPSMDVEAALLNAAAHFVNKDRRERFVHEARRKPAKLMGRICHDIESVFDSKFRHGIYSFQDDEQCLVFSMSGRMALRRSSVIKPWVKFKH